MIKIVGPGRANCVGKSRNFFFSEQTIVGNGQVLFVFKKGVVGGVVSAARNKFKDKNCWQERIAARFKALILSFCFYKTVAFPRLDRYTHCAKSSNMF